MKLHHAFCTLIVALFFASGCRLQDIRTVEIHAPRVRSPEARAIVLPALKMLRGVDLAATTFDYENGVVTVTYDSMLVAVKNIEFAFTESGFDANELPAEPLAKARLPKALQ